jgi:hypothetical protein
MAEIIKDAILAQRPETPRRRANEIKGNCFGGAP